jgi:hypothetical protein
MMLPRPVSVAATAQEHADDAGDDFPLLDDSCVDVPPCALPRPHDIPEPHAWQLPSDTRDHASAIDVRSEMCRSRRAGEIRQDDRASNLAYESRRPVAWRRHGREQRARLEANPFESAFHRDGGAEGQVVCRE